VRRERVRERELLERLKRGAAVRLRLRLLRRLLLLLAVLPGEDE